MICLPSSRDVSFTVSRRGAVALLALTLIGCGDGGPPKPDFYAAKGVVTYSGNPVPNASVIFRPETGPVAFGTTNEKGEFTLSSGANDGAVAGKHEITVTDPAAPAANIPEAPTPEDLVKLSNAPKSKAPAAKPSIPEKYSRFETSGLSQTIDTDPTKNEFKLDLQP